MKIFSLVFTKHIAFGHSRIFLYVNKAEKLEDALLMAQEEFKGNGLDPGEMSFIIANEFFVPDPQPESLKVVLPKTKADPVMEGLLKTAAETASEIIDRRRNEKNELMKRIIKGKDRALLDEHRSEFKDYEIAFLEEELRK
jgi:hypothetical protein